MKEKLPCGIVRDLMPLVIDEVACEDTKAAVAGHLEDCPECARLYEQLKRPEPAPAVDGQSERHFREAMRSARRRSRVWKIIAVLMAAVLLVCGFLVAANPQILLNVSSEVPVSWMQNAHLVRTAESIVLLRFTPSEQYRAFYGMDHMEGEGGADGGMNWSLWYDHPLFAGLFGLDPADADQQDGQKICLPDGDWLVPLSALDPMVYDEATGTVVSVEWHDATTEEMQALTEQGVQVTGRTRIAAADPDSVVADFSLAGPDGRVTVYRRGDEVPLLDEEAQQLVAQMLERYPEMFVLPGQVRVDGQN